ncbi:MAG: carbohydrate-binding domain-containing protein [Provencibacterium sp.]|nr:carbohydrate-binding domain-containing protein [Provencibacterium sp.]
MRKNIYLLAAAVLFILLAGGIIFAVMLRASLLGEGFEGVPVSTEKPLEQIAPEKTPAGEMTTIQLEGNSATVSGSGVNFYGGVLTIQEGGNYTISGTLEPGQIVVNPKGKQAVTLYLDGVKIYHPSEPALQIKSDGRTLLALKGDTVSRLQSGRERDISGVKEGDGSGAAIHAKSDLFIAGEGALQVLGYLHNGIQAGGRMVIESGKLDIVAAGTALKGEQSVTIEQGEFSLKAGEDGIRADDASSKGQGSVSISGGSFIIKSGGDGIEAQTALDIRDGVFSISSGIYEQTPPVPSGENSWDREELSIPSAKGLKSGGDIHLYDGSVAVESPDDAIHAAGTVVLSGGSGTFAAGDDGIYAGEQLTVSSGTFRISRSYQGMKGSQIVVHGGSLSIDSVSDGIHSCGRAADGSLPSLRIEDGVLEITPGQNGLSSDGSLYIKGGNILIDGPQDSACRAIRFSPEKGGSCKISGGLLLAADNAGLQDISCISRSFLSQRFSSPLEAESEVVVSAENGIVLFSCTLHKPASSLLFLSPELYPWRSYQIEAGGRSLTPPLQKGTNGSWWKFWER